MELRAGEVPWSPIDDPMYLLLLPAGHQPQRTPQAYLDLMEDKDITRGRQEYPNVK